MDSAPLASVIILTKDAGPSFALVLKAVLTQDCSFDYEVIVVDSGSTDETIRIVQDSKAQLFEVPAETFGHGKTRNLGARLARGEYLVYLTQDAKPANDWWLEYLVAAVADDERIAGAYSRQIPYDGCNPCEARDMVDHMPVIRQVRSIDVDHPFEQAYYQQNLNKLITFSNVSSCIRRSAWEQHSFDETLPMCEDQKWCKDVLEAGHRIVYEPYSLILHSHNYRPREIYRRNLEYGLSFRYFAHSIPSWWKAVRRWGLHVCLDWLYLVSYSSSWLIRLKWFFLVPVYRATEVYGLWRGWQKPSEAS